MTNSNTSIVSDIRQALTDSINPKVLASSDRFFKTGEAAKIHGVGMGEVSKIGKLSLKQIKELSKQEISKHRANAT